MPLAITVLPFVRINELWSNRPLEQVVQHLVAVGLAEANNPGSHARAKIQCLYASDGVYADYRLINVR